MNRWIRKLHRWGAIGIAIPLLLVIVTGLLLQVKKQVPWVQPATQRGTAGIPLTSWDSILEAAKSERNSGVGSWSDIGRLDVQPQRGIIKIICRNGWELQLDHQSGTVLSSQFRRSDLIESLHDGSFFSDSTKLWVFLPNGLILLSLWLTGAWLWWLPFQSARRKKKRLAAVEAGAPEKT